MSIKGVNHITLVVADLVESHRFYGDLLGAKTAAIGPNSIYLELGSLWLCLEAGSPTDRQDDTHIALDCDAESFAAIAPKLKQHARIWKANTSQGQSVYFLDPDGHKLELHVGTLRDRLAHYAAHPEASVKVMKLD